MTTTTPLPGFGQVQYEINANPMSALWQATPATLTSSDPNQETPEGGLAPEPPAIYSAGQSLTESTVVPTVTPTPLGLTHIQPTNTEAATQPTSTIIDAPHALPTPLSTGMLGTTSMQTDPELE
ncbi:hypothetical protein ACOSP7_027142 [Xanthoceras sorbifolium]